MCLCILECPIDKTVSFDCQGSDRKHGLKIIYYYTFRCFHQFGVPELEVNVPFGTLSYSS